MRPSVSMSPKPLVNAKFHCRPSQLRAMPVWPRIVVPLKSCRRITLTTPAHRIRAVDGGGAVEQDLDAVDGVGGDHVQVGELLLAIVGQAVGRDAAAVDQHQGRGHAQAAQRDPRGAGREAVAEAGRHRPALSTPASAAARPRSGGRTFDVGAVHGEDRGAVSPGSGGFWSRCFDARDRRLGRAASWASVDPGVSWARPPGMAGGAISAMPMAPPRRTGGVWFGISVFQSCPDSSA